MKKKQSNYAHLVEECHILQWGACCKPIEMGCRVFVAQSLYKAYSLLGIRCAQEDGHQNHHSRESLQMTEDQKEQSVITCYLDISQELITPNWVTWVRVSVSCL